MKPPPICSGCNKPMTPGPEWECRDCGTVIGLADLLDRANDATLAWAHREHCMPLMPCGHPKKYETFAVPGPVGCLACDNERLQTERDKAMRGLESLTVGGSEFVGDVDACVSYARKRLTTLQDLAKNSVKRAQDEAARALRADRFADVLRRDLKWHISAELLRSEHALHSNAAPADRQIELNTIIETALAKLEADR